MVNEEILEKWLEENDELKIVDMTNDECAIKLQLDEMKWLNILPAFKGEYVEVTVATGRGEIVSQLCDKVVITGGTQLICKDKGGIELFTVWTYNVDHITLTNDGIEVRV